jgi:hypothetical protein
VYHTKNIELLEANSAQYNQTTMQVDGNVTLHQKEDFSYYAQHGVYDKETKILTVPSEFVGIMNENSIHGQRLRYNMQTREIIAQEIHAIFYTSEK